MLRVFSFGRAASRTFGALASGYPLHHPCALRARAGASPAPTGGSATIPLATRHFVARVSPLRGSRIKYLILATRARSAILDTRGSPQVTKPRRGSCRVSLIFQKAPSINLKICLKSITLQH
jgi:hypothetical protein